MKTLQLLLFILIFQNGLCQVKFEELTILTPPPSKGKITSVIAVTRKYQDKSHPETSTNKDSTLYIYNKDRLIARSVEYKRKDSLVTDIIYNKEKQPTEYLYWDETHKKIRHKEEYEYDISGNKIAYRGYVKGELMLIRRYAYDTYGNMVKEWSEGDKEHIGISIDYDARTAVSRNFTDYQQPRDKTYHKLYYSKKGQLLKQEFIMDSIVKNTTIFKYDKRGYKIMEQSGGMLTIYKNTYDRKRNITSVETYDDGILTERTIFYITYK